MKRVCLLLLSLSSTVGLLSTDVTGQYVWTKDPRNPVLTGLAPGAWNHNVFNPCVIYNGDSARYEMWFGAASSELRPWYIGFATSKDRVTWKMEPSPVLSPGAGTWDRGTVEAQTVLRENGQYKMWYASFLNDVSPGYIGYATSPDGVHWTKHPSNPIVNPGTSAWEALGPYNCTVLPVTGGYKIWYSGYDVSGPKAKIGYATSSDGITWVRDTVHNPVFAPGSTGAWDDYDVHQPVVLQKGGKYYLWYVGQRNSQINLTGVAVSADGITNWQRYGANPVLTTTPGGWDASNATVSSVLLRATGDSLDMWYDGDGPGLPQSIGHATAPWIATGVHDPVTRDMPAGYSLAQNYPNPFNPATEIGFRIVEFGFVKLAVYDLLGQEVAVLVNERKAPGRYEVKFEAAGLASGVYLYRLTAGTFVQTRKMIVAK